MAESFLILPFFKFQDSVMEMIHECSTGKLSTEYLVNRR